MPALFHTGQTGIGAGLPGGRGIKLRYSGADAARRRRRRLPGPDDRDGAPVGALAGRGHLHRHPQGQRLHRPVRLVAEVLPAATGPGRQQRCCKHKVLFGSDFPLLTPERWLRDFDGLDIKDRGATADPQGQRGPRARVCDRAPDDLPPPDRQVPSPVARRTPPSPGCHDCRLTGRTPAATSRLRPVPVRRPAHRGRTAVLGKLRGCSTPGPAAAGRVLGEGRVPVPGPADADRPGPDGARGDHRRPAPCPARCTHGFRNFELARTDASIATMYNAQSGLFRTAVTPRRQPGSRPPSWTRGSAAST